MQTASHKKTHYMYWDNKSNDWEFIIKKNVVHVVKQYILSSERKEVSIQHSIYTKNNLEEWQDKDTVDGGKIREFNDSTSIPQKMPNNFLQAAETFSLQQRDPTLPHWPANRQFWLHCRCGEWITISSVLYIFWPNFIFFLCLVLLVFLARYEAIYIGFNPGIF